MADDGEIIMGKKIEGSEVVQLANARARIQWLEFLLTTWIQNSDGIETLAEVRGDSKTALGIIEPGDVTK